MSESTSRYKNHAKTEFARCVRGQCARACALTSLQRETWPPTSPVPKRRRRWYNPISIMRSIYIRPRVYLGAAVGIALLWFMPRSIPAPVRETTAWCLGAAVYLALAFRLMRSCHSDRIKLRAGVQDDSGILILGLILLAIFQVSAPSLDCSAKRRSPRATGRCSLSGSRPPRSSSLGW